MHPFFICLIIAIFLCDPLLFLILLAIVIYGLIKCDVSRTHTVHSPYRYPIAFDQAVSALKTYTHGPDSWYIAYQNADEGHIQARFKYVKHRLNKPSEHNLIVLDVFLTAAEEARTEIELRYNMEAATYSWTRDGIVSDTTSELKDALDHEPPQKIEVVDVTDRDDRRDQAMISQS